MTKRKTAAFHGAWVDETLTGGKPLPAWNPEAVEAAFSREECAAHAKILTRIENEPGKIAADPVIAELKLQLGKWRLNRQWQESDPEPNQWADLLRAINVPDTPDYHDVDRLRRQIDALPVRVVGVLNGALFQRAEIGRVELFERMMKDAAKCGGVASPADAALLRGVLIDMIESLGYVRGRTGPNARGDCGPAFRALVAAIVANADGVRETSARMLAAELLRDAGIPITQSRQNLAKLAKEPPR